MRLYDHLFTALQPGMSDAPLLQELNTRSLHTVSAYVEPVWPVRSLMKNSSSSGMATLSQIVWIIELGHWYLTEQRA